MVHASSPPDGTKPGWLLHGPPSGLRWSTMARVALRMALHDRQKTFGAVLGVAFAYLLLGENISMTGHYLDSSTAYVDHSGADLWIGSPATKGVLVTGQLISTSALHQARATPNVAWADPIVKGNVWVRLPDGGARGMYLIGATAPDFHGGPFNIIQGDKSALSKPNAIIVDDVERESLGGVKFGDTLEISLRRMRIEGLTWGTFSISGPCTFAEYDYARSVLEIDADQTSFVLVGVAPGVSPDRVKADLLSRIPNVAIMTTDEFRGVTHDFVLYEAGIIGVLGMGIFIGVTVGLAIVTLAVMSSIQQNLREFATLKAIGATNADLRRVVFLQAIGYTLAGSFVGGALLCQLAWIVRSAHLIMMVPASLLFGLVPFVMLIAMVAAVLAIRRLHKVEPGSVFQ